MDFVETEGDSIDAAIESALKLLGVGRDKITVDIISEGRKGILGFGSQKARIRAELRKSTMDRQTEEPKPAVGEPTAASVEASEIAEKARGHGSAARRKGQTTKEDRHRRSAQCRRPSDHARRASGRSLGVDPKSRPRFLSPAVDYSRRRSQEKGSGRVAAAE